MLISEHFVIVLLLEARLRRHVSRRRPRPRLLKFARHVRNKARKIMMNRVLLLRPIKQLQPRLTLAYLGTVYLWNARQSCKFRVKVAGFWNTPSAPSVIVAVEIFTKASSRLKKNEWCGVLMINAAFHFSNEACRAYWNLVHLRQRFSPNFEERTCDFYFILFWMFYLNIF